MTLLGARQEWVHCFGARKFVSGSCSWGGREPEAASLQSGAIFLPTLPATSEAQAPGNTHAKALGRRLALCMSLCLRGHPAGDLNASPRGPALMCFLSLRESFWVSPLGQGLKTHLKNAQLLKPEGLASGQ